MNFGNDDNLIWLVVLIIVFVNFMDKKECEAPEDDTCEAKQEPEYIYRNPKRNRTRRRLVY